MAHYVELSVRSCYSLGLGEKVLLLPTWWCCSSPSRVCPYLLGHFLILSFFHVFRFSAYPALVLGTFFGPTVCSFPYGCNTHLVAQAAAEKKKSQITPTPKGMGLSARRSGGGGAAQGHSNQSSGARSTTAATLLALTISTHYNLNTHSGIPGPFCCLASSM